MSEPPAHPDELLVSLPSFLRRLFPKAGVLALVAVAEHAGEFDKIIDLSQRYLSRYIDTITKVGLICLFSPDLSCSPRFPGFVFPCLGVHPVQEVSPGQQRGAVLQVKSRLKGNFTQNYQTRQPKFSQVLSCFIG